MKSFNAHGRKTKSFQLVWNEPLGKKECPYAYRWVFIFFKFSIRIHHFIRSDDKRYFHDHPWWFITIPIKGFYYDVSPLGVIKRKFLIPYYVKSTHKHYVNVPKGGCWTIIFTGKMSRKWGFWVDNKLKRPLKYFHKYGHPPCNEQ